jgi:hypothetical protein
MKKANISGNSGRMRNWIQLSNSLDTCSTHLKVTLALVLKSFHEGREYLLDYPSLIEMEEGKTSYSLICSSKSTKKCKASLSASTFNHQNKEYALWYRNEHKHTCIEDDECDGK